MNDTPRLTKPDLRDLFALFDAVDEMPVSYTALLPALQAMLQALNRFSRLAILLTFRPIRQEPFADSAVALRRFDEQAKVAGLATPGLKHFRPFLEAVLVAQRS